MKFFERLESIAFAVTVYLENLTAKKRKQLLFGLHAPVYKAEKSLF